MITVLIIIGILSGALFDNLSVSKSINLVFSLQKQSLKTSSNSKLSDEQKQKELLSIAVKLLGTTLKLILLFLIVLLPLTGFVIISNFICKQANIYDLAVSLKGAAIYSIAFVLYYFIKKVYARFSL